MPAQWLSSSSEIPGKITYALERTLHYLAQPAHNRRLRQVIILLLALWALQALSRLIWLALPVPEGEVPSPERIINPVSVQGSGVETRAVDIDRVIAWHLFGKAGEGPPSGAIPDLQDQQSPGPDLEGIEKGARETRLDLILRGVVASSDEAEGHAIIEHNNRQAVYTLDDRLPVSGTVTLAKVMPQQVVLDNGGTYELLTLFEETSLDRQVQEEPPAPKAPATAASAAVDKRQDGATTRLASGYREKLYRDPQSLASMVQISAVREDGQLLGYRVAPGEEQEQFEQLGFKGGDLVTGVNGIPLSDPANTVRLYQTLRSASEAVFEVERGGQQLTIAVGLE